jgi:hypothetical protein
MAACLPRRATEASTSRPSSQPKVAPAGPPSAGAKGSGPPTAPVVQGAPVLLPINAGCTGKHEKTDRGDNLPRAALHGAGDSTSPALSPATARSRKSGRKVTFGNEEIQQFEAVGKMRSIR